MSDEISVERQQLRMIVEAIKKIVTNPRTPNWVKNPLEAAVREAKSLKPSTPQAEEKTAPEEPQIEPVELCVGRLCRNSVLSDDKCMYKIVREGLVIDGVHLYDVEVVKGDKRTPQGIIQHNVPATLLRGVQGPLHEPSSAQSR